jgi:hypothetical protein
MAVGKSRRIVVDVEDVHLKRRLYAALAREGTTLKDWFVRAAVEWLEAREERAQLGLQLGGQPIAAEARRRRR